MLAWPVLQFVVFYIVTRANAVLYSFQQYDLLEDAVFHYWIFSRMGFDDVLLDMATRDPYLHLVGMDQLLDRRQ